MDDKLRNAKRNMRMDPEDPANREDIKRTERRIVKDPRPPCPGCGSREHMRWDKDVAEQIRNPTSFLATVIDPYVCQKCNCIGFKKKLPKDFRSVRRPPEKIKHLTRSLFAVDPTAPNVSAEIKRKSEAWDRFLNEMGDK